VIHRIEKLTLAYLIQVQSKWSNRE